MSNVGERLAQLSPAQREILLKKMQKSGKKVKQSKIEKRDNRDDFPISFQQQRLWFLHQLERNSAFYNIPSAVKLSGNLDIPILEKSINEIINRHEILRASFSVDENGMPSQEIRNEFYLSLNTIALSGSTSSKKDLELQNQLKSKASIPFNLEKAPLFSFILFKLNNDEYVLQVNMHHIIADGWSIGVFIQELTSLYRAFSTNGPNPLPEIRLQYADYAHWQANLVQDDILEKQLSYWTDYLKGVPPQLELPLDLSRPTIASHEGKQYIFQVDNNILAKSRSLSREQNVSLYITMMAAFQAFLYKISGQDDFCVGAPIANRNHSEIENLIGFFVNTIALRADFSKDITFTDLIARVRDDVYEASSNQDVPFEKIVDTVVSNRELSYSPLFQVMFDLQKYPFKSINIGELNIEILDIEIETSKFDLLLLLLEDDDVIKGTFEYNTSLFEFHTIERLTKSFLSFLGQMVNNAEQKISSFNILTDQQEQILLKDWNHTKRVYDSEYCIHHIFEKNALNFPNNIALIYKSQEFTYDSLNQSSNQMAHYLLKNGAKPEDLIGIYSERSAEVIIAILAILKIGCAYVPLDSAYPKERIRFMIEDAKVHILLTQRRSSGIFNPDDVKEFCFEDMWDHISGEGKSNIDVDVTPENIAYTIYTSGSTGIPKGISCLHKSVINLLADFKNRGILGNGNRYSLWTSLNFDVSVYEILSPLLEEGTLVITPEEIRVNSIQFFEWLTEYNINSGYIPPFMLNDFALWLENNKSKPPLKRLLVGVEPIKQEVLTEIIKNIPQLNIINGYGPTESTVCATLFSFEKSNQLEHVTPIGRPVQNSQIYVLDKYLMPVPIGTPGELHIAGDGLARGYFNRPDITAEKFIPNLFSAVQGSRLYKTGDIVKYLPSGNVEFVGRIDRQVKFRGFRIELGEIESVISENKKIKEVIVRILGEEAENKKIVAYLIPHQNSRIDLISLKKLLNENLPDYMTPSNFIILDKFPITPNGKIDRKALPAPQSNRNQISQNFIAPRNKLEKYLASLWKEILQIDKVGIYDNFFELGGNSLKAAIFANRIQKEFEEEVHVGAVFKTQHISEMSMYISEYFPDLVKTKFGIIGDSENKYNVKIGKEDEIKKIDTNSLSQFRKIINPLQVGPKTAKPKNKKAVFLLSPPRSGSTLLRILLAGNPKLFSPPELDLLSFNTLKERKEAFSTEGLEIWMEAAIRAIIEIKNCSADEAQRIMSECEENDLTSREFYALLQDWLGDRYIVDKTPTYAFDPEILKRAEDDFDDPLYIHLVRHPYAMVYSFIEAKLDQNFFRHKHSFTRRELAELIWLISNQNILKFFKNVPQERRYLIKFEDLVATPRIELERLCKFMNIEFYEDMLKPYEGKKMTDGVRDNTQMVGDFKFYLHKNINITVAEKWRTYHSNDFLSNMSWELADKFGYQVEKTLAEKLTGERHRTLTKIKTLPREDTELPLSFAQQRLWFLDQLEPGKANYNLPVSIQVDGELNKSILIKSVYELAKRQQSLRTVFKAVDGRAQQVILSEPDITIKEFNLSKSDKKLHTAEIKRIIAKEARKPFNLSQGPLLRLVIIRISASEHILTLNMHHIISDGISITIFIKELLTIYSTIFENKETELPDLPIQYTDYALWQRDLLQDDRLARELAFWEKQIKGAPPLLELPMDFVRPAVQSFKGKRILFELNAELSESIRALANQYNTTVFMILVSVFNVLLYRYSQQETILIGTPVANRNRREVEGLIGFFINTLILRADFSKNITYKEIFIQMQESTVGAFEHQDIPFEKIVDSLNIDRNLSHNPLFQVMFAFQPQMLPEDSISTLTFKPLETDTGIAKFDITLSMAERKGTLRGEWEYNTDLFRDETAQQMITHFQRLMHEVVINPEANVLEISMLSPTEISHIIHDFNTVPSLEYPDESCIHLEFEKQVLKIADDTALVFQGQALNYAQLNSRANQLAHYLRKKGIQADEFVGISMERSLEMIIGILGILKAGAAYVPMDPSYPQERLSYFVKDMAMKIILTNDSFLETVRQFSGGCDIVSLDSTWPEIAKEEISNPVNKTDSNNLCYVIYTSGSTGLPKGVEVQHNTIINLAFNYVRTFELGPGKRVLQYFSSSFDGSVGDIFKALLSGAALYLVGADEMNPDGGLSTLIRDNKITNAILPPSILPVLPENVFPDLQVLASAGDVSTPEMAAKCSPGRKYYNAYGPTETSVCASLYLANRLPNGSTTVPIGKPIANVRIYILDKKLNPVPRGVMGEIYISGAGLTRGYHNLADITARQFIPDPFSKVPGKRMYASGDLGHYLADGNIEFHGRIDHQVKVRGFRIELGEIESRLSAHPDVNETIVLVKGAAESKQLVSYIVLKKNSQCKANDLREFLKLSVPEYMVPAYYIFLDTMPLAATGKVDKKSLPEPEISREDLSSKFIDASSERELELQKIWQEILSVEKIGIRDNFFELGGDSILSIQVIARANQAGIKITPKQLFENPTIEKLASVAGITTVIQADQGIVTGAFPLTAIQQDFFAWNLQNKHHWNQTMMISLDKLLDTKILVQVMDHLISHHDILRARFIESGSSVQTRISAPIDNSSFQVVELSDISPIKINSELEKSVAQAQASLNLTDGPLLRTFYYKTVEGKPDYLLIVIHHLVVDVVSWRILTEDLLALYGQISVGQPVKLPPKTTSFKYWAERISEFALSKVVHSELEYWRALNSKSIYPLPKDKEGRNTEATTQILQVSLSSDETHALLKEVPAAYQTRINEILLTALVRAGKHWHGYDCIFIDMESHGREDLFNDVDISRTIGWFTSTYPLYLQLKEISDPGESIKSIKEQYRKVPNNGIGFGLLNFLNKNLISDTARPEIGFNYLGQFQQNSSEKKMLGKLITAPGFERSTSNERIHSLEIGGSVLANVLQITFAYSKEQYFDETIQTWANQYLSELRELISHCQDPESGAYTPSDFEDVDLDENEIGDLLSELEE